MAPRASSVPPQSRGCVLRGCEQRPCWFHSEHSGSCSHLCHPLGDFTPCAVGPGRGTQPHLTESLWLCDAKKPKPNTPKNPQGAEYPSLLPLPTLPVAKQSQAGAVWEGIFALMPSVVARAIRRRCACISTGHSAMLLFLW